LAKKKENNPGFILEAEKQDLIWKAFGVDYSREIKQLGEAREQFLLKLKSNLISDDVKEIIEEIVRDEVRRILRKTGQNMENHHENIMEKTRGGRS
jgi:Glu-tRNA(Gln) amidotransferase subunit E-like FAD-binding protein